uniref:Uncharacterized protein n=1 Tax=Avena sativa TaxID=4498 RepID=A0ACD5UDS0_AVESA
MKQAVRDILKDVAPGESDTMTSELWKLVTLLKVSLEDKRYLIVVDDVWDKDFWQTISSAFLSSNCHGSRIIITTRNYDVAHAFCPSPNDVIHRMKYLTDIESEALFCQRVFPEGSGCPPELRSLAVEILKKCAGVPLAIVTLSSLLASEQIQPAHKWHALLGSIGRGLVDRSSSEEMRKILLLSYDDLPVELRTFLLYMSLFPPELFSQTDFVWKMVAEGFIQPEKQRTCSEVAASYFNEIVNRNLVNARCRNIFGEVVACELHGILLEILRSLSKELNFTHVLDSTDDIMPPGRLVRRLSISYNQDQFGAQEHINSIEMSQVRSLMISPPSACVLDLSGLLSRCKILRVLDLSGCSLSNIDLKVVCNLIYLRYLNLSDTDVSQLPEDIGRLQLLQYLSVSYCRALEVFPSSIRHLRRLMYLSAINTCLLDGLGNLLDLEVLCSRGLSVSSAEDLRNLSNLRYLQIHFENQSLEFESSILVSVSKLLNIQDVNFHGQFHSLDLLAEKWAAHKNLRSFDTFHSGPFSQLPAFLKKDPLQFSMLLQLSLLVKELVQEDISVLGRLPALVSLKVESTTQVEPVLSVDADGFECLIHLDLCCKSKAQIFFCEGALRKVKKLHISIGMRAVNKNGNGDCPLSLQGSLGSLQHGFVTIYRAGPIEQTREVIDAVKRVFQDHPNAPRLTYSISGSNYTAYTCDCVRMDKRSG